MEFLLGAVLEDVSSNEATLNILGILCHFAQPVKIALLATAAEMAAAVVEIFINDLDSRFLITLDDSGGRCLLSSQASGYFARARPRDLHEAGKAMGYRIAKMMNDRRNDSELASDAWPMLKAIIRDNAFVRAKHHCRVHSYPRFFNEFLSRNA